VETLGSFIPDVQVLLAMAPEELAPILLRLAHLHSQGRMFHPNNMDSSLPPSYRQRQNEVEVALSEAWQWLRLNMLIVPVGGINGTHGWMTLSRRGAAVVNNDCDFQRFREAAAFPKSMLHPAIADKVWLALARGDLDDAVFAAFKAVEEAVREAGGFGLTHYGGDLMRNALKPGGPLANPVQPKPEQEALAHLFAGAIALQRHLIHSRMRLYSRVW